MRAISTIFLILFSVSSHLVHASTMLEDHRGSPIPSGFQAGVPTMTEDDSLSRLLVQRLEEASKGNIEFSKLIWNVIKNDLSKDTLTEDHEKLILTTLKDDDFITISNYGWEAEHTGDDKLAFICLRLAAIGDRMADQDQLAHYYLGKKDYKSAARWYLRSALNNNSDILAVLYRIDEKTGILQHLNSEGLPQAMTILETYWKNQDTEG
ncbi:hypothetical protein IM40_02735 [Candidatus Paracaedimonas acanthamoebae]|nr:hypothetical protein IM40_02735 [Candidatus Paracaedimonas acanthamoebae]